MNLKKIQKMGQNIANTTLLTLCFVLFYLGSTSVSNAKPKYSTEFGRTAKGHVRARIKNDTNVPLACYIAIDGYQKKFRLSGQMKSKWYAATNAQVNYKNFSFWCDYIEYHPQYKNYSLG